MSPILNVVIGNWISAALGFLSLIAITTLVMDSSSARAESDLDLASVVARVRAATGFDHLRDHAPGLRLTGSANLYSIEGPYSLLFNTSGMFLKRVDSRAGETIGFDGDVTWSVDSTGGRRVLDFSEREMVHAMVAAQTGAWLSGDSRWELSLSDADTTDQFVAVRLRLKGALRDASLFIDRETWLPSKLVMLDPFSQEHVVRLEDYREALGARFARRITLTFSDGLTNRWMVHAVEPAPVFVMSPFTPPSSAPVGVQFDPAVSPTVSIERCWTGHLLIHPLVNGRDVGKFILDTGAAHTVISAAAAEALGLPAIGKTHLSGAGEQVIPSVLRQSESIQIGPATLSDVVLFELDMRPVSTTLRADLAGVIGYDLFMRCIAELNVSADTLDLFDSAACELPSGAWQNLQLHQKHPLVPGHFEGDRAGLFLWDTGAAANPVLFNAPAVERLKLLEGRETVPVQLGGVGGPGGARMGSIEWFKLAGRRFENPRAVFITPQKGAGGDPYIDGIIGNVFIAPFTVVLNYPAGKIAFLPLEKPAR